MAWNPEKYDEFKSFRYKPFFDLISHISDKPEMKVLDLGCGTGELTSMLAGGLTNPLVLGIDSSKEMLEKAEKFKNDKIHFEQKTIQEQVNSEEKWDLIMAQASLQWVDNHKELFPQTISRLNLGGQLAVQMPSQNENMVNQIILKLAQEEPFSSALNNWKRIYPVLSLDDYAQMIFENGGKDITIYQKVYPLIINSQDELFELVSGTTLVPYFERLDGEIKQQFIQELKSRIKAKYPVIPAIYSFKRIILYATF